MRIKISYVLILSCIPLSISCQDDKTEATLILNKFLENSSKGDHFGWNGSTKDPLWLNATDYEDKVMNLSKKLNLPFHLTQSENAYFVLSYSLDSILVLNDFAIGYTTLSSISHGYCMGPLPIKKETIPKVYLLMKQHDKWFVISETNDWFISVNTYIKWIDRLVTDPNYAAKFDKINDDVRNNYNSFKQFLVTNLK